MSTNQVPKFFHTGYGSTYALEAKLCKPLYSQAVKQPYNTFQGRTIRLLSLEACNLVEIALRPFRLLELSFKTPLNLALGPYTRKFSVLQGGLCLIAIPFNLLGTLLSPIELAFAATRTGIKVVKKPEFPAEEKRIYEEERLPDIAALQNITFRSILEKIEKESKEKN